MTLLLLTMMMIVLTKIMITVIMITLIMTMMITITMIMIAMLYNDHDYADHEHINQDRKMRKQRGARLTLLNCSKLSLPVDSVERCLMMRFFQPIPPHTQYHRHWCFTNPILTTFSIVDHHHQVTLRHHLLHHGRLASLLRPAFCCAHCPAAFFSASVLKKHVQANHV